MRRLSVFACRPPAARPPPAARCATQQLTHVYGRFQIIQQVTGIRTRLSPPHHDFLFYEYHRLKLIATVRIHDAPLQPLIALNAHL